MKNLKKFEVELRGPLTRRQLSSLSNFLKIKGKFLGKFNQLVIFFQENKLLNLPKDSLRIIKDESGEMVCFKNTINKSSCFELEFSLKKGEYKKVIIFFQYLGFKNFSIAPAERKDFIYKNTLITLKDKCIIGPHYEIEIIVNSKRRITEAKEKLYSTASSLGLKIWTEREYLEHKSHCWRNLEKYNVKFK